MFSQAFCPSLRTLCFYILGLHSDSVPGIAFSPDNIAGEKTKILLTMNLRKEIKGNQTKQLYREPGSPDKWLILDLEQGKFTMSLWYISLLECMEGLNKLANKNK